MPMLNEYFPPDMKIEDWVELCEHREVTASCVPEMNHSRSMAMEVEVVVAAAGHDDTHGLVVEVEEHPFHCRYHVQVASRWFHWWESFADCARVFVALVVLAAEANSDIDGSVLMEEEAGAGMVHGGGKEVAVEGDSSEDRFGHNTLADHQM
jgi:hypothetical protein